MLFAYKDKRLKDNLAVVVTLDEALDLFCGCESVLKGYVVVQGVDDRSDELADISFHVPVTCQ